MLTLTLCWAGLLAVLEGGSAGLLGCWPSLRVVVLGCWAAGLLGCRPSLRVVVLGCWAAGCWLLPGDMVRVTPPMICPYIFEDFPCSGNLPFMNNEGDSRSLPPNPNPLFSFILTMYCANKLLLTSDVVVTILYNDIAWTESDLLSYFWVECASFVRTCLRDRPAVPLMNLFRLVEFL